MTYETRGQPGPDDIKSLVEKSLDADKALNITTIDLSGQSPLADYMIIASGTSSRHVGALATKIRDKLESHGVKNIRIEGLPTSDWVVVDAGDVIVHIFRPEVRSFYNIEKMWGPYAGFNVIGQQVTA
ncbi:MAG: ribosome silencing factor [Micavibrio sp.]|nr:ribosome silencing factor [Micavibrio sp.]MBK9563030.1 ribosome silencing factor [Micavibrio sp.]